MAKPQSITNPFYALLLIVGLVFAITACAYGVLMVQTMGPLPVTSGLLLWLQKWGTQALVGEIVVLAILTCAAFATDSYWTSRSGKTEKFPPDGP